MVSDSFLSAYLHGRQQAKEIKKEIDVLKKRKQELEGDLLQAEQLLIKAFHNDPGTLSLTFCGCTLGTKAKTPRLRVENEPDLIGFLEKDYPHAVKKSISEPAVRDIIQKQGVPLKGVEIVPAGTNLTVKEVDDNAKEKILAKFQAIFGEQKKEGVI